MNNYKIRHRLREKIYSFSRNLSYGLPKVVRRFVGEMIYGIQARSSVRLSEIGRSLNEEIPLIKTIDRLSKNLGREGLRHALSEAILK